jgi:uncharacterized membrane protein
MAVRRYCMGTGIMIIAAGAVLLVVTIIITVVVKLRQKNEYGQLFETLKKDYWLG